MTELTQTLAAQLHALGVTTRRQLDALRRDERGNVTIEQVLWAIAAIAFVGIVIAVITTYLNDQAAKIH